MANRARAVFSLLCALPFAAAACAAESPPEQSVVDASNFSDEVVRAFCDGLATCCLMQMPPYQFVRAECERSFRAGLEERITASPAARFSATSAQRCLDNIRAAVGSCSPIQLAPCDRVYTGTAALGEACEQDGDCSDIPGQTETCTHGVCKARIRGGLGDSCARSCLWDESCVPAEGADFDSEDPAVTSWTDCFAGDHLVCVDQTCQPAPDAGSPCFEGSVCDKGLTCDAAAGLCVTATSTCMDCKPEEFCSDANVCEPKRVDGTPCLTDVYCLSGLCEVETLQCVEAVSLGSAHGTELECLGRTHF